MNQNEIEVHNDGVDHIRISPSAKTLLGRLLANEAYTPFRHPVLGTFASLEAFWAYVRSGGEISWVRSLIGHQARQATVQTAKVRRLNFREMICEGLELKIDQKEELKQLISANKLPFFRYELLDGEPVVETTQPWFLSHLKKIAKGLACKPKTQTA